MTANCTNQILLISLMRMKSSQQMEFFRQVKCAWCDSYGHWWRHHLSSLILHNCMVSMENHQEFNFKLLMITYDYLYLTRLQYGDKNIGGKYCMLFIVVLILIVIYSFELTLMFCYVDSADPVGVLMKTRSSNLLIYIYVLNSLNYIQQVKHSENIGLAWREAQINVGKMT